MATDAPWLVAVDTGGTFTDACAIAPEGHVHRVKLLSSSRLRARVESLFESNDDGELCRLRLDRGFGTASGFLKGFEVRAGSATATVADWDAETCELRLDRPIPLEAGAAIDLFTGEEVPLLAARLLTGTRIGHPLPPLDLRLATTRGTNALLECKGTPPVMVLPRGFGDLLEIGDQRRPDLFALEHRKRRQPLAKVIELRGRLDCAGTELEALDISELENAIGSIPDEHRRCAAVALLNSYRNPEHEREAAALLKDSGFEHVSVSCELATGMRLLPRAQTAATDAYLAPVMNHFVERVRSGGGAELLMMTSAGGLEPADVFRPKDSLLSGPAGGLVGALDVARAAGMVDFITFDMGGTSTDVARVSDGRLPYRFEQRIGNASVLAPSLHIETVAAGGGSICSLKPEGLEVGPESAGADPGPACYGRGGPLTVTDVNLLLGRIEPDRASIPLDPQAAQEAFSKLKETMRAAEIPIPQDSDLLEGLLEIAIERMADAIRKISVREGYDPADHTLIAFGGAGPQHACAVANALGIKRVMIPGDAGLLSARGVGTARLERFREASILQPLAAVADTLAAQLLELEREALAALSQPGSTHRRIAQLRLSGQEETLEIDIGDPATLAIQYAERFEALFGYPPPASREIELVSMRVCAATDVAAPLPINFSPVGAISERRTESNAFFTLVTEPGWFIRRSEDGTVLLERAKNNKVHEKRASPLELDITRHRLSAVIEGMGAVLKRCAISTNVREREDFSCALLDSEGQLAINAPHIPVHLGALGLCVRDVAAGLDLEPGDIAITNHPAHGGSHLPDITVIAAVFDDVGHRLAYLANRAHHAEIGGISPGSMPPDAGNLAEEGAVIAPRLLFRRGEPQFDAIADAIGTGAYPSRNLADNMADLHAQSAALRSAVEAVEAMDAALIRASVTALLERSASLAAKCIAGLPFTERSAIERMDSGAEIHVAIRRDGDRLEIDFGGTSPTLSENLNATPAIVRSATLYVLRLMLDDDLPLNEGMLAPVTIVLPECFLNPEFALDPARCPPVVGGNVETSQRLVDTLLKALGLQAGSQGTMNNLLFGNTAFGYYETIAGGAGAGAGYQGADALHTHMTNTAITDPEVLEWRYPVRLREFSIRRGSGGTGKHRGGHGVVREFEFLEPLTLSILAEHRKECPAGQHGGGDGAPGRQMWFAPDGTEHPLPGRFSGNIPAGSRVRIETPGGGAWGASEPAP